MMKCPGCANDMVMIEVHSIEIDRCPSCGGIALDKGETEVIDSLGLANVIEGGVTASHGDRTTVARCHECDRDMIALVGAGEVEYDWCEGCERLFFDRGELTALDAFVDV
ncbi:MAG: zf-TFIIB domain-containing protein [Deltaproteobacteria bacterium]|nr:zf-TFIIB domain-containing protein [Deltaproteobacteria bacterium]MCW5802595.1 zf-TFIIB domain-containing protein [Deltaproteobacteria bacterium]